MILETGRLKIMALSYQQLMVYLRANNEFEAAFNLTDTGRTVSNDVARMVETFTLPKIKSAPNDNYLYITFWIVIDKTTDCIVAELGFKGIPNGAGEIEIGYGTMPGCRSKGYMTEAVDAMINWASGQQEVTTVLAETNQTNYASIKVLTKNGFVQFNRKGEMLWWRKKVRGEG